MQNLTNMGILKPKYILWIAFILIFIIVSINVYELLTSKQDIMKILQEEAISLAESISIMGDNSLECFNMIEELVFKRLMDNARILENMDYKGQLTEDDLKALTGRNHIYRVDILSMKGNVIMTSQKDIALSSEIKDLITRISPILNGVEKESIIIINKAEKDHYAAGIHRRKGGAIIVSLHSYEILKLRQTSGIGNLVQNIGENEGIEYIVLQDQYGLILASKNIKEMKKISGDEFLENAIKNKWMDTRKYLFNDREVLEVLTYSHD